MSAQTPAPTWTRLVGDLDRPPERRTIVRILVLVSLAFAIIAAAMSGATTATGAVAAIVVMAVGSAVADWRRDDTRPWIALGVTILTLALIVRFAMVHRNVASPAELRSPLAELLMAMECCRSFSMRTRRDLRFALSSGAALLAVGASMSLAIDFVGPMVGWALATAAALSSAHRSDVLERTVVADALPAARRQGRRRLQMLGPPAVAIGLAALVATGVFLVVPAAKSSKFLAAISRLPGEHKVPRQGGLSNPALGADNPANGDAEQTSDGPRASYGYFGFASRLDTALRGRPDDTLVMRVRSSAPDFWRGQSFDRWDGRQWTMTDERSEAVGGRNPITVKLLPDEPPTAGSELIQTYYLEVPGPNVIFAASRPVQVYIPQSALFQLADGTLRTGVELEAGTIYTVVSQRPYSSAIRLRAAGDTAQTAPLGLRERFGILTSPPTPRVIALANRLTATAPTTYDKVLALQSWIAANTEYSLDIPPLPDGTDAVDQFLFVDRKGFCEQIATSLVIMLRTQGIPARLAVGYAPGERNPFTGLYEVRAKDAHAWAEVFFPGVGWQAFDPTANVPLAGDAQTDAARVGLGSYLAAHLGPHRRLLISLLAGLVALALAAALWRPIGRVVRRHIQRRRASWADRQLAQLERLGAKLGRSREPSETVAEYAAVLQRTVLRDERLGQVAAQLQVDAFSPDEASAEARADVEQLIEELELAARRS